MKEFSATMDKKTKRLTLLGILIFFVFLGLTTPSILDNPKNGYISIILLAVVLIFAYLVPFLYRPIKYVITNDELIIVRLIKPYKIRLNEIKKVEPISKEDLKGTVRVFGSGGAFGYFGKFRNKKYGTMTFFTTRTDNRVYILTSEGKNIIISPDDSENFVSSLKELI